MPIIIPPNQFVPYIEHFGDEEEVPEEKKGKEGDEENPPAEPSREV